MKTFRITGISELFVLVSLIKFKQAMRVNEKAKG